MQRVIGIDLGTSNSCVAIMQDGVPTVIANRDGYRTTPSVVALTERKRRLVGHRAKRQAITNAEHTAHAVKRLIGRTWDSEEAAVVRKTAPYKIVEGPHGDIRVTLQGDAYSIPELSAMVASPAPQRTIGLDAARVKLAHRDHRPFGAIERRR